MKCVVFIAPVVCVIRQLETSLCVAMNVADYDAPVAENGDLTEKYFIIQKVLREMLPNSEGVLCVALFSE